MKGVLIMGKLIMVAIGVYIFNLEHWIFKFIRIGVYGLLSIDLLKNFKAFNLYNIFIIIIAFIMLASPHILKYFFKRKVYCR